MNEHAPDCCDAQSVKSVTSTQAARHATRVWVRCRHPVLGILIATWACAYQQAAWGTGVGITDARGVTQQFAAPPQRIITLLPSLTESVCALDACERLVATDRYSNYPAAVMALPKVGGIDDTPLEWVLSLHPDVVLAARSSRALNRLEELHIPVIAEEPQTLADVQHSMQTLARLLDKPAALAHWQQQLERQLQQARNDVPIQRHQQRVYLEVSEDRYAAGQDSYLGELLASLGVQSVIPSGYGAFPKLNAEWIINHPPDVIITDSVSLKAMAKRAEIAHLKAYQHKQVCGFSRAQFELLSRPGPRVGEAALLLSHCLATLPPSPGLDQPSKPKVN
jgi:iron complex transport system substrate-binding protein